MTKEIPPLTTREIGRYLHVDLTTVINWCEQGKLRAYKTPGGHRRVQPRNFLEFLQEYGMPVPAEFSQRLKGAIKILIVDDEADIRKVVRRVIKRLIPSAEIFEAQDGFEAGKLASDSLPNLVVLDLKLPGIDGFRVCADFKKDERFEQTKILAITGQDTPENHQRILQTGADDYLPKPFDVSQLREKIERLLDLPKKQNEQNR